MFAQLQLLMGSLADSSATSDAAGDPTSVQESETPASDNAPSEDAPSNSIDNGVALLQSILVHPELSAVQHKLANLERSYGELEQQLNQSTKLAELLVPLIAELLNRQSVQFKQDLNAAIQPLVDRIQTLEDRLADQELSIHVTGINSTERSI